MKLWVGVMIMSVFFSASFYLLIRPTPVHLPTKTNPICFYKTPTLSRLYPQAIKTAEISCHLFAFNLKEMPIVRELQNRSIKGIPVKVVYDANHCRGLSSHLGSSIHSVPKFVRGGLMHNKILACDNQAYIGSANFTKDSLEKHYNFAAGFYSQTLSSMIQEKTQSKSPMPHRIFPIGSQQFEMWFLPDDRGGLDRFKELIQSAKKTIKVAMYTFTNSILADELVRAKQRGVQVTLYLERAQLQGVGKEVFKTLKNNTVGIRVNQPGSLLHHKMMVVDETTLAAGSVNWTRNGFLKNHDCFFVLHDLTQEQKEGLDECWQELDSACMAAIPTGS
jgi:phosphatidylserine/phosphatidylglycerophosphate/cardiolipin synthase-like enzyme